ncbi:serine/threonine protein phosphatase [Xanthomonas sp. NCPPB 1325]|uniref:serine/threonine protein phosphatase n=1 Tax=Xanthomonas sp. NCPPB 1325 TaxID=487529 RepID=UPI0035591E28
MAEPIVIAGQRVWLKQYRRSNRAVSLGALNFVARRWGLDALRPPPHRGGDAARDLEARRLGELHAQSVNVPRVVGCGQAALILSDNGRSFATCLREADVPERDRLVALAVSAMVHAHGHGAYFGQPLPRNMTFDGQSVGFIDFEEDPLEVMDLAQAQARDWLVFGYGVAKYYRGRREVLQRLLARAFDTAGPAVVEHAHTVTGRLRRVAQVARGLGRSAGALGRAIQAIHAASAFGVVLVLVLCVDWCADGEMDLLAALL